MLKTVVCAIILLYIFVAVKLLTPYAYEFFSPVTKAVIYCVLTYIMKLAQVKKLCCSTLLTTAFSVIKSNKS